MLDVFDLKSIKPMLLSMSEPFSSDDYIYELKLDGVRCLAYLENGKTALRARSQADLHFDELMNIHEYSSCRRAVLDGELIALKDGVPSFSLLMKRLMSGRFSQRALSKSIPVYYVAFDIVYLDGKDLFKTPQIERKKILCERIEEKGNLSLSRYIFKEGERLFENAAQANLEGVVAKRMDGVYLPSKRAREWLKIKVFKTMKAAVCGIEYTAKGNIALITGFYGEDGKLYPRGKAGVPDKREADFFINYAKKHPHKMYENFDAYQKGIFVKPGIFAQIKYSSLTDNGTMRDPIFVRVLQ